MTEINPALLFLGIVLLMWSHVKFGMIPSSLMLAYVYATFGNFLLIKIISILYGLYCMRCIYFEMKKNGYLAYFVSYDLDTMKEDIQKSKSNRYQDIIFRERLNEFKNKDLGLYRAYMELLKQEN